MDHIALKNTIRINLESVVERVHSAAQRKGRSPDSVLLVAVSKTQPAELIQVAYDAGIRDFGENRLEEALPKMEALSDLDDIRWHMIGHIQSRKAQHAVSGFELVHSVDRLKLARRLNQFAVRSNTILPILLECNVSGEDSKSGWAATDSDTWGAIIPEFSQIVALPNLEIKGLMTMAPWVKDDAILRPVFQRLKQFQSFLQRETDGNWNELSMGMTDDFEIAIEEGASIVRIGRAIFGSRKSI
jgi:PLP dependent protein